MAPPPSSTPPTIPSKPAFACVRCAERKVKCDRQRPTCGACVSHKVDCVFQPPRLPQRKQKHHAQVQLLTDQLRSYENLLREHGIDPRKPLETQGSSKSNRGPSTISTADADRSHRQTPSSVGSEPSGSVSKTQLIHGKGRSMFVDNSLWSRVVEEFHDSEDILEVPSKDSDPNDIETADEDFGFVLYSQPKASARLWHPPPERMHQLWQIFVANIDPLTKLVHVSTLGPSIQMAANNTGAIPQNFEALLFSIYSTAILSLDDCECTRRLGEPRKSLLLRYITATKIALSRAKFMGTTSLVVLQALVLHLISIRDAYEPRAVWSLTGVAVRIAQGMGLERDGEFLGLSPFETEIRRRVWWLLKSHDYQSAERCGLSKFRDLDAGPESTKPPTNVSDDQVYPDMSAPVAESNTLTDVAFVALRYELISFAAGRITRFRQRGKDSSEWERDLASGGSNTEMDEAVKEMEGLLETKFLRYCDPSKPLHLMTMLMARSAMNTIRFLTHHPRRWSGIGQIPPSERQWVWEVSINLLEQHHMLQTNPQLKRFAWHASFVMQWHAFIHVLDTLRHTPLMRDAGKAWELIGNTYQNNPVMVLDTRKPIHVAVGSLCLKAYDARTTALQQNGNPTTSPVPEFILQLRYQREIANAKRQTRNGKNTQLEHSALQGQSEPLNAAPKTDNGIFSFDDTEEPQPSSLAQNGDGDTNVDAFWLINGFDDSVGSFNEVNQTMSTSLDFTQTQDSNVEGNNCQAVTWEQWDAWLLESNVLPSDVAQNIREGT